MEKIDFKKTMKHLYNASDKKVSMVEVPDMKYIMTEGKGSPGGTDFQQAIEAIYSLAYTLKFMLKDPELQPSGYYDFVVPPLETLWCTDSGEFDEKKPDDWKWTVMVMQPGFINAGLLEKAKEEVRKKKNIPGLNKLQLSVHKEGNAIQIMHIGPYNEVGNTYKRLDSELKERGFKSNGPGHEIYLSDPRRVAPEKLKTIVRLPYQ